MKQLRGLVIIWFGFCEGLPSLHKLNSVTVLLSYIFWPTNLNVKDAVCDFFLVLKNTKSLWFSGCEAAFGSIHSDANSMLTYPSWIGKRSSKITTLLNLVQYSSCLIKYDYKIISKAKISATQVKFKPQNVTFEPRLNRKIRDINILEKQMGEQA